MKGMIETTLCCLVAFTFKWVAFEFAKF